MIEKIIKAVKSSNKRRGRNITIGAVIGFLLSCTAVAGVEDKYLWIKNDNDEIKFNTTETTSSGGTWNEKNPYVDAGNIWNSTTKTYVNNMTLSSSKANGKGTYNGKEVNISYGLRLSEDMTGLNFINNGSITGIISDSDKGFGIYNDGGTITKLTNNGLISGSDSGIYNNGGTIETLTNNGLISGSDSGIWNAGGKITKLTNNGLISDSDSGIRNDGGTIETLTNNGLIISGSDSGIWNYSGGTIETLTNNGLISGYGYGINI